jgi:hypothetical protein
MYFRFYFSLFNDKLIFLTALLFIVLIWKELLEVHINEKVQEGRGREGMS